MSSNSELIIKTKVWEKENIELIDYLNSETIDNFFQVKSSGVIRREKQLISFHPGSQLPKTNKDLITVERNNITGKYSINCGTWSKNLIKLVDENAIFMVYKGTIMREYHDVHDKQFYKLSQGDIIKLGRIYLKVLDINTIKEKDNKDKKKNNKISSKYKGTMIHSSSSSYMFINGQQIIKGAFSSKYLGKNKKQSQILFNKNNLNFSNSILTPRKKNIKDQDSFNIDLLTQRKVVNLPRINFRDELFFLKKLPFKNKNRKISQDIFLKKHLDIPKNKPTCRICYADNNTEENPLICPCVCKGSMKYIHYMCLKSWLNSKIEEELLDDSTENNNKDCISYNKNSICCELCKSKYPDYIIHNNIYYNILFYKPQYKEYIIFESMKVGRDKTKYYHVLNLDDKDFVNIGRANECDLSLAELSVSRFHCMIYKDQGQLYLEDNTSKFGTLVLVQNKNMIVNDYRSLRLQVNKTLIKFKLELPFSFKLDCCGIQNTLENKKLDYHEQNKKGFDVLSFFVIKDDSNVWGIDDDNEEEKNNNININNIKANTNIKNQKEKKEKKENELIDNDEENKINEINNNNSNDKNKNKFYEEEKNDINYININNSDNKEEKKEKESLIDKSIVDDNNLINNNNNNNNDNEDFVEIESENKHESIKEDKIEEINIKKKEDTKKELNNNKKEKNTLQKLHTTKIKKINIKKLKNERDNLQKLNKVNLDSIKDNMSVSLISNKQKKHIFDNDINNRINNTMRNKSNFIQTDSYLNNKNNLNIFNPRIIEQYNDIKENFTDKKDE